MKNENGYFKWEKGEHHQFGEYFNCSEFEDRYSPKNSPHKLNEILLLKLIEIRKLFGKPIIITSGFRTQTTQDFLRKSGYETSIGISTHELGDAVDIAVKGNKDDFNYLYELCKKQFKSVGLASNFIHVDMREDKIRHWFYKK